MTTTVPILPPYPQRGVPPENYIPLADDWSKALPPFGEAVNAVGEESAAAAFAAEGSATAAAISAAEALAAADETAVYAQTAVNAPGTSATSTTSLTVGLGIQNLTVQAGKNFVVGQFVIVANTAAPNIYMLAQIRSYNGLSGALQINVVDLKGSGTLAAWTLSLSAPYTNPNDALVGMAILAFLTA